MRFFHGKPGKCIGPIASRLRGVRKLTMNAARILAALFGAAILALALPAYASAGYGWPVKPFHKEHAVRGQLNDPRMEDRVISASSTCSFHPGVDIVAPDGTAVYAVEPGYVYYIDPSALAVRGKKGIAIFGYWHIRPVVRNHVKVKLHALLGYITRNHNHVHFSEKRKGRYVNPLRRGGLTPYSDNTRPTIATLSYYDGASFRELKNATLAGKVKLTVGAYDTPGLVSNWPWAVVTPARISWQLYDDNGLKLRTGHWDFSSTLCPSDPLAVFVPDTLQNGPQNGGRYDYWLGQEWDTTTAADGAYWLVVTVADVRGNETTRIVGFTVANAVEPPARDEPASPAPVV